MNMNLEDVRNIVDNVDLEIAGSVVVKFVQKTRHGYEVYTPGIARDIKRVLKDIYLETLDSRNVNMPQKEYNPNVSEDGYITFAPLETAQMDTAIEQIHIEENQHGDIDDIKIENINFYCIEFCHNNETVYFFRKFSKMKKLRKGVVGVIVDNQFTRMQNEHFLGIDCEIDIIVYNEEALIINRYALQTIFNLSDYFIERANQAFEIVENADVINNFDEFRNHCLGDMKATQRMTKIMNTPNRIAEFIAHKDNLPGVIADAKLDIELDGDGKIVYVNDREIRSQIIFCMADAYYLSLLLGRVGEDVAQ